MYDLFIVFSPGLESITAKELHEMGYQSFSIESGGIAFQGNLNDIYKLNLQLRTASRILIRLGHFHASAFSELEKKSSRLPWETYLTPSLAISLRATCHKSRLYHSNGVIERVVSGIGKHLGFVPNFITTENVEEPNINQLVSIRLLNDDCTISIDTSGELLHRRGYRLANAKAPLRETLAAGIIIASGWEKDKPFLDPFCGSGTIPIEAALIALGIPPGLKRRFAFMSWPKYEADTWTSLLEGFIKNPPKELPLILASDRDAGAISMAYENAKRAGVADFIQFECKAVSAITPPTDPGWVITNPPYGLRIHSNKDIRNLYAQFGKVLRSNCSNWKAAVLCSNKTLLSQTGIKFTPTLHFSNGGINVSLGECIIS